MCPNNAKPIVIQVISFEYKLPLNEHLTNVFIICKTLHNFYIYIKKNKEIIKVWSKTKRFMPATSSNFYSNFRVKTEYFALKTCSTLIKQQPAAEVPREVFHLNFIHCSISFIFLRFYVIQPIRRQRLHGEG